MSSSGKNKKKGKNKIQTPPSSEPQQAKANEEETETPSSSLSETQPPEPAHADQTKFTKIEEQLILTDENVAHPSPSHAAPAAEATSSPPSSGRVDELSSQSHPPVISPTEAQDENSSDGVSSDVGKGEAEEPAPAPAPPAPPAPAPAPSAPASDAPPSAPAPALSISSTSMASSWGWGLGVGFGSNLNQMMGRIKESATSTVKDLSLGIAEIQQALSDPPRRAAEGSGEGSGEGDGDEEEGEEAKGDEGEEEWEKVDADNTKQMTETAQPPQLALCATLKTKSESNPDDDDTQNVLMARSSETSKPNMLASWGGLGGSGGVGASWGVLFSGAAKALASKVEVMSQGVSQGALGKIGSSIGTSLEKGLETVGRTAFELIEDVVAGHFIPPPAAPLAVGGGYPEVMVDVEPRTFDDFFSLYGGQQLHEEILSLSNGCSKTCNRSRGRLEAGQQDHLDALATSLASTFHLPLDQLLAPVDQPPSDGTQSSDLCWEMIEKRYDPIAYLAASCKQRAKLIRAPLSPPPPPPRKLSSKSHDEKMLRGDGDESNEEKEELDGDDGSSSSSTRGLRERTSSRGLGGDDGSSSSSTPPPIATANKRLAELASAQLQLLNDLALSLAAPSRGILTGAGNQDLPWPSDSDHQALILRRLIQRMLIDLAEASEALAEASEALAEASEAFATNATEAVREENVTDMADGIEAEIDGHVDKVREGWRDDLKASGARGQGIIVEAFRGIMYCLVVRSLVDHVASGE